MLQENVDYVICKTAAFMDAKSPLKQGRGICISTKNHLFFLPTLTIGTHPLLQTYKSHAHFDGVSIEEGVQNLLKNAENVKDLEDSLSALLEDNPRNVHRISSYGKFVISGLFIKNNMRLINSRFDYYACILKPKAVASEFRQFHGK